MANLRMLIKFFAPCPENNFRPQFLESGLLIFVVGIFLFLKIINISIFIYLPQTSFFAEIAESSLIELTNQKRQALKFPTLTLNPRLSEAAYLKAKDMLEKGYFAHTSPSGTTPWFWFKKAKYSYVLAGENLGIGFIDSKDLFNAWYNSPSHRENILNPNYKETGIAVLKGRLKGNETTIVVQLFGTPASSTSEPISPQKPVASTSSTRLSPREIESGLQQSQERQEDKDRKIVEGEGLVIVEEKTQEIISTTDRKIGQTQRDFYIQIFKFIAMGYGGILEVTIAMFLGAIIIILLLTIIFNTDLQHKDVILKSLGIIIFLTILLAVNDELLVRLIPHKLAI